MEPPSFLRGRFCFRPALKVRFSVEFLANLTISIYIIIYIQFFIIKPLKEVSLLTAIYQIRDLLINLESIGLIWESIGIVGVKFHYL